MTGPLIESRREIVASLLSTLFLAFLGLGLVPRPTVAQNAKAESIPGQFFVIEEPINSDVLNRMKSASKQVIFRHGKDVTPVLVFEFRPGRNQPGASEMGASFELAEFLSTELGGATVVAYVPEPLKGYAVIPVLACDEIVMGPKGSIGPISPEEKGVNQALRDPLRILAKRKGREPDLFLGLLDRDADLREVRTADKQLRYVMADRLDEFKRTNQVIEEKRAWDGGARGILTARRAREEGFVKLLIENRAEIVNAYRLDGSALSNDPTLFQDPKPVWIQLDGPIDPKMQNYLASRLDKARKDGANLVFLGIRSAGGIDSAAENIARMLLDAKELKTVAYIDDKALGLATVVALACDDIVMRKGAKIGDVTRLMTGRNSFEPLSDKILGSLAERVEGIADQKGHPSAIARAMVDKSSVLMEAKDTKTGSATFVLQSKIDAEPGRYLNAVRRKDAGQVLTLSASEAAGFGLARSVADDEELKGLYNLKGKVIRVEGPTWVDGLVTTLNDPFISGLILFIGIFMLILEVKMPGVGLPAILSVLAFLLFFWSRFLSGTADQLEIMLFVVGLICLGLELFVFPGFGVFGMSGVLLILVSIVMASHTFVWPTQEYEYRQMATTLFQVTSVLVVTAIGASILGRYLPSIPIFNRLVLKPDEAHQLEIDEYTGKPLDEGEASFVYLLGETGRTTTVLRPAGKAKFGDLLFDVMADGVFIDPDTLVEVVEIRGATVIVRPRV